MKHSPVQAFKYLASKIHPQVALSEPESKRLLGALTSSFRRQLDAAYPSPTSRHGNDVRTEERSRNAGLTAGTSATDSLLASVLTSPLLAGAHDHGGRSYMRKGRTNAVAHEEPISVFRKYVSQGAATLDVALACLSAFRSTLSLMASHQRKARVMEVQAGKTVLDWLQSSSYTSSDVFAGDLRLVELLVDSLVAEGQEEAVWTFMARVDDKVTAPRPTKGSSRICPPAFLLRSLVMAHISCDVAGGREAAIAAFLRAIDVSQSPAFAQIPRGLFLCRAGAYLVRLLSTEAVATVSNPTYVALFDQFVRSCSLWRPPAHAQHSVAMLMLYHPTSPSALPGLDYVRYLNTNPGHALLLPDSPRRQVTLRYLFKIVQGLRAQGFDDDAVWVMDFMRKHFKECLTDSHHAAASIADTVQDGRHPPAQHGRGRSKGSSQDLIQRLLVPG